MACVLVPHITITPEFTALETGQHSLWAAIEISGRLSEVSPERLGFVGESYRDVVADPFSFDQEAQGLFEFGCLYDLTAEVVSATNTTILQVLSEQAFPTTICAKSNLLLLAKIQVQVEDAPRMRSKGHGRQRSDDLIEDLEVELGSTQLEYMHVKVTYSHSAFPQRADTESVGGVSAMQSKVETTATATLKLHNTFSPWSPPPASAPNPLFQLVQQHCGVGRITRVNHPIPNGRPISKKLITSKQPSIKVVTNDDDTSLPGTAVATVPAVPAHHARLEQETPIRQTRDIRVPEDEATNVALVSTKRDRRIFSRRRDNPVPPKKGADQPSTIAYQGRDQESPLWKRRSFGTDTIRGLLPSMIGDLTMACPDHEPSKSSQADDVGTKSKKEGNRWSWGAWFS